MIWRTFEQEEPVVGKRVVIVTDAKFVTTEKYKGKIHRFDGSPTYLMEDAYTGWSIPGKTKWCYECDVARESQGLGPEEWSYFRNSQPFTGSEIIVKGREGSFVYLYESMGVKTDTRFFHVLHKKTICILGPGNMWMYKHDDEGDKC